MPQSKPTRKPAPAKPKPVQGRSTKPILELPADEVLEAPWNYKVAGTPEQLEKLKNSIRRDGSAGIIAVRKLPNGKYEAIDGNHRLRVLKDMGYPTIRVENFGTLNEADARLVAVRRNTQWFEDDPVELSRQFNQNVKLTVEQLEKFMPHDKAQLEALFKLANFDWSSLPDAPASSGGAKMGLTVPEKLKKHFDIWNTISQQVFGTNDRVESLEMLAVLGLWKVQPLLDAMRAAGPEKAKAMRASYRNKFKAAVVPILKTGVMK